MKDSAIPSRLSWADELEFEEKYVMDGSLPDPNSTTHEFKSKMKRRKKRKKKLSIAKLDPGGSLLLEAAHGITPLDPTLAGVYTEIFQSLSETTFLSIIQPLDDPVSDLMCQLRHS